ncbi:aminotransferase-like domain-containing protein [Moritella viscosa]|uniref:aminotransferase-like domain-containing protein n=1 Tax=Moritella viscosa TaxID=80854 RepID=UPI000913A840|nr:PLP-dependent aminotransferase family protein [Moritella viscosa]SGY92774.1 Transcriptional regulator, GntR family [Moritella viscosa]
MTKVLLYQQISNDLCELIHQGVYLPGEKLPSLRALSVKRKVSIATIQRAVEELEIIGLIEARPKSGYYVCFKTRTEVAIEQPIISMKPKSVKIHELASQIFHQCGAPDVINMGTSYPSSDFMPTPALQKIANQVIKHHMSDIVEVQFSAGHAVLRDVLAKRMNESGCQVTSNDIIVTNGCLEALSVCLRAVAKPGATIALESPGFVGSLQLIESLGYKALEIPCHSVTGMSLEALELALEQWKISAVLVVPSYSNPLGSCMPEANRKKLVALLSTHDIPLIEDDLLGDLSFDGSRLKPCKAFDKKGMVLYCSSVSKTIASGLRVGWIAPGAYYKEVSYFKTFTNISAPQFSQIVVAQFYNSGKYERHLRQLTAKIAKQVYLIQSYIRQYFPEGTLVSSPQGGCILWVVLPKGIDGHHLYLKAIKMGIGVIPGQLSSATNKFDHCIRINCACDPKVDIQRSIKTLADISHEILGK